MVKDIGELTKKLVQEKFGGIVPKWEKFDMKGTPVLFAKDKNNIYILKGNVIYVQKDGTGYMTCYKCGSDIQSITQIVSLWLKGYNVAGGSGKTKEREMPYCPKCEKEPKKHDVEFSNAA